MKRIAIIGASYLQMPLVKKAKEMGLEVHCFAWEENAVCKDIADFFYPISIIEKKQILEVCQKVKVDAVTTIASDVAVLTVNYVASKMGLISNDDRYSLITTNKYLMRQCFIDHNIPSPKFCSFDGILPIDVELFKYPLIVKPTDRSGSLGVEKVYTPENLKIAATSACNASFQKKAIIEEYVNGHEISVEAISNKGIHYILQITDKVITSEPFFVELEHHQPSTLPEDIKERVCAIVLKALDALYIEYGASHSELKITEEGDIIVIEIGARMGGDFIGSDLVRLSTGYDFVKGVIEVAFGNFEKPKFTLNKHSGVYFLCKETKGLKKIIKNYRHYPEIIDAAITEPVFRNIKCSADRSGYLIYQSDIKYVPMF